jgi:hypothetical protein
MNANYAEEERVGTKNDCQLCRRGEGRYLE